MKGWRGVEEDEKSLFGWREEWRERSDGGRDSPLGPINLDPSINGRIQQIRPNLGEMDGGGWGGVEGESTSIVWLEGDEEGEERWRENLSPCVHYNASFYQWKDAHSHLLFN
ncbi:hypothetical protein TIFTF001_002824 [Ficus carica]|uniref:Uncharacterized protein n=1 Tax=Ficus carica TaxID=3494 RepID=A0AA87ZDG4_FICCA|nr:hypothetical protein TIFTF001_002824 [Ficus carica]